MNQSSHQSEVIKRNETPTIKPIYNFKPIKNIASECWSTRIEEKKAAEIKQDIYKSDSYSKKQVTSIKCVMKVNKPSKFLVLGTSRVAEKEKQISIKRNSAFSLTKISCALNSKK